MAAKSTAAKPTEKKTPAKKPAAKKPAVKPVVDASAPAKAAKPPVLKFRDLWKERGNGITQYVQMFRTSDEARLYVDYAEDQVPDLLPRFTAPMLHVMAEDTKQDVLRAFRRALVSYNLDKLSASQMQIVQREYNAQSIKNWRDEFAMPSENTIDALMQEGIYLLAGSPLADDQNFQPRKTPAHTYVEGDEFFELFTKRDLDRVQHLPKDYESAITRANFDDYEALSKLSAFRAMLELWPESFRHYVNNGDDLVTWTFVTDAFRAVVRADRVEVIVGTDDQGYSFFAKARSLQDAVERIFHYFDTLSSEQLETVLRGVGFGLRAVAGMGFDVLAGIPQNPAQFMAAVPDKKIQMDDGKSAFNAADFLILAAGATRGIVFERDDTHGDFDIFRLSVDDLAFRIMYMDSSVYENGPHRGAASLREHTDQLARGRKTLLKHGIYVDENNVMHLPISPDAESNFHPEIGVSPSDETFYMHSVTFV